MVLRATDSFEVEWRDPADAELTWVWDQLHYPRPVPPIVMDIVANRPQGQRRLERINGYLYYTVSPPPPGRRSGPANRDAAAVWAEVEPVIKAACDRTRLMDVDSMSTPDLVVMLPRLFEQQDAALAAMSRSLAGLWGPPMNALARFCETEIGAEGPMLAATAVQGFENDSVSAAIALSTLAQRAAREWPDVAEKLRAGLFAEIAVANGGDAFSSVFREFLDEFGWQLSSWHAVHVPTWAEDPSVPLKLVKHYLSDPAASPVAAHASARRAGEEAAASIEGRLTAGRRQEFARLLSAARSHVPVSEGRAHYQLTAPGVLRVPLLALGRKLAAAGDLNQADDIFYLRLSEFPGSGTGSPEAKGLVQERRREMEHFAVLTPPRFIGRRPRPAEGVQSWFLGYTDTPSPAVDTRRLSGLAASRGVVTAPARIILDLTEADRLEAGQVLVCPSTAPPWTPLFSIASAVVTESGGVLSHSAIAAREYGIPAVVGVRGATLTIPDGAVVTVDGGEGTVRIED